MWQDLRGCGRASKWVSDCLRRGNEGLKKYYKGLKRGGEVLRRREGFKEGEGREKGERKNRNGEISICVSTIGHYTLQGHCPKSKKCGTNSFSRPLRCNIDHLSMIYTA